MEAGAGGGELVFELGHPACEAVGLGGLGAEECFQPGFVLVEFMDPDGEIGGADLVEPLAEVEARVVLEPVAFGAEFADLLAGQFEIERRLVVPAGLSRLEWRGAACPLMAASTCSRTPSA
ncbi:hypothetical protein [Streptomyces sp. NBC_01314]|uniref:hypothetical protein n=1 Tax=Streptomyces sp. NBC_01314 TaxID=2903821 RepID=UPI00308A427A|nr:hypothetical protein OG622_02375 [Streptomyces sp. NBC_01314]